MGQRDLVVEVEIVVVLRDPTSHGWALETHS
jgi:hypothetical protein